MSELERGTQILYVPSHADGDVSHCDVEVGFVTQDAGERGAFCRYWSKSSAHTLRTKANSELTPREMIIVQDTVPQALVVNALHEYC